MKLLCLVVLLAIGFCQSLPEPMQNEMEFFEKSIVVDAMLFDIEVAMDREDFYPLYFLKYVVPTCDSLTYVNWNQTRKLLEESLYPTKQKGYYNRDAGLVQRKKLNVSTMRRKKLNVSTMPF